MFASLMIWRVGFILPEFAWEKPGFRFSAVYPLRAVMVAQHSEPERFLKGIECLIMRRVRGLSMPLA